MGNLSLFIAVFVLGIASLALADQDGIIDIDDSSVPQVGAAASNEGSGSNGDDEDGEDSSASVLSDEGSGGGGSGSGEKATTEATDETTTEKVDVNVVTPTRAKTTKKTKKTTGTTEHTTEMSNEIDASTPKEKKSTKHEDQSTKAPTSLSNGIDAQALAGPEEKVLRVLTTEVIAAVVVGAVCAVILIAFLVYRLRKRDEGSYPLNDSSYKDTYKLRGDTGKEAFV